MRQKIITGLFLSIILVVLSGCSSENSGEIQLFQYKNSYVGDNSAVSAIAQRLPAPSREQLDTFELKTTTEPYGITLNYTLKEQFDGVELGEDYVKAAIQSSALMLALVQNAEMVTLNYVDDQYTITKQDMELWLGKPLNTFVSELQLISYMEFYLEDPNKVNQLIQ